MIIQDRLYMELLLFGVLMMLFLLINSIFLYKQRLKDLVSLMLIFGIAMCSFEIMWGLCTFYAVPHALTYGNVKNSELYSADITDKLPAKTVSVNQEDGTGSVMKSVFEDEQMVTIPASVFRHCGYDALTLSLLDADDNILATTSQKLVAMDAPMNLSLNDGKSLSLKAGDTASVDFHYDTTAFINNGVVLFTVADPTIAEVDEDASPDTWYHDGVHWALVKGVMNGTSETTFSPDTPVTREQLATILYRYAQAQGEGFTGAWMFPLDFSDAASVSQWADEAMLLILKKRT